MQAALEVTARYCGRELEQYGQCVAAKPESWQRDCHYLKMSIAQCTSSHPIIRQIRQACAQPFEAFEECLRQNEAAVGNCAEHMRRFLQCAEQVQPPRSPATVEVRGAHLSSSLFSITSPSSFWLFRVKTLESSSAPPHHHTGLCHASRIQNIITSCPI
ncbi:CHCHD5 isoform 1 [Pan troglodytes]|uniref:CHCHD5 isoform 1 n=2 Tax=Homininae TaxID=207598 RepID=A0A2J8IVV7_PANTR|nr:coiled-coil-helix-coiled-coil-helix domain-containing protein 5 isoform X1 [Homo sapiens]XP_054200150.1 coiled-coil-helix-coiled-coil-helix domain-containing protein 5 isoform X1 [Homo sapiens]PNI14643.1 CHCHD5 isoform 1 [Pan troglodytes]KAI2524787.1 coiled-coil-helix-coiled-coil-helix domain containing 5 [Homo sapiens]KAI4035940.1 coiled-coil-helix-coiled-coil-helix domain containing 5 [Homo sapiens]BAC04922.1 unnamed protein product [Homo sapiens]|eukprot:XP_005263881.1 coiled-coil-helix-coiled-coil-helix domain-containing protein 5 isoform X1 [Homo sapiens]